MFVLKNCDFSDLHLYQCNFTYEPGLNEKVELVYDLSDKTGSLLD